jgi:enediyne biosynthesis protein E4
LLSGCARVAVASAGGAGAGHGGDGHLDIVGLNYQQQPNALSRKEGDGFFENMSLRAGIGYSIPLVGWGTDFLHLDNDGDLDIFVTNGHLQDRVGEYDATTSYAQLNQAPLNDGTGRYIPATDLCPGLTIRKSSRGLASADIDVDGDLGLIVTSAGDSPDLLINDAADHAGWLRVRLVGRESNRSGIGGRVTVTAGGPKRVAEVRGGSG